MYIINRLINTEVEATLGGRKRPLALHLLYVKDANVYDPLTLVYGSNGMVALAQVGRYGKKLWPIWIEARISLDKRGGFKVQLRPGTMYLTGQTRGSDATRLVAWNDPEYVKHLSHHSTYGMAPRTPHEQMMRDFAKSERVED